jgi:hypothetical protein
VISVTMRRPADRHTHYVGLAFSVLVWAMFLSCCDQRWPKSDMRNILIMPWAAPWGSGTLPPPAAPPFPCHSVWNVKEGVCFCQWKQPLCAEIDSDYCTWLSWGGGLLGLIPTGFKPELLSYYRHYNTRCSPYISSTCSAPAQPRSRASRTVTAARSTWDCGARWLISAKLCLYYPH